MVIVLNNYDSTLQERAARKVACKFIAEVGQNLMHPASIIAINSAKIFLNRHYMVEALDNSADKLYKQKVLFFNLRIRKLDLIVSNSWLGSRVCLLLAKRRSVLGRSKNLFGHGIRSIPTPAYFHLGGRKKFAVFI